MPVVEAPHDSDSLPRMANEIFRSRVQPTLRPEDHGKYVAIEVVSSDFEIDADDYTAVMRLRTRQPEGNIWLERAGYPVAYKFRRLNANSVRSLTHPRAAHGVFGVSG